MKLKFWPFLLVALMWACGDDDSVAPEKPNDPDLETPETPVVRKMSYEMHGYEEAGFDYWIILSDDQGAILDHKKMVNNTTYTFDAPAEFNGNVINLTLVRNERPQINGEYVDRSVIATYTDVPFGVYGDSPLKTAPQQQPLGYVSVDGFLNSEQYGTYVVSAPQRGDVSYKFERYDQAMIYLRDTTDRSAVMIMTQKAPFSYLYTEMNGSENYERSLDDFKIADVQQVYAPEGATTMSAALFGETDRGLFTYFSGPPLTVESGAISVPYVRDVFDTYTGYYSTAIEDDVYRQYFTGRTTLPTVMSTLNAKIDYTLKDNVLSWQTTGAIDIARVRAAAVGAFSKGDAVYWDVYAGASKQITPPVIPDDIILSGAKEGVYKRFQDLADGRTLRTEIVDGTDFNGYVDYVIGLYLKTGTRPALTGYRSREGK